MQILHVFIHKPRKEVGPQDMDLFSTKRRRGAKMDSLRGKETRDAGKREKLHWLADSDLPGFLGNLPGKSG